MYHESPRPAPRTLRPEPADAGVADPTPRVHLGWPGRPGAGWLLPWVAASALIVAPGRAHAHVLVLPEASEGQAECVAISAGHVELTVDPRGSVSETSLVLATPEGGMRARVLIPVIAEGPAPTATLDEVGLPLARLEASEGTRLLAELAKRRPTPAIVAWSGLVLYTAELALSSGEHRLVARSTPFVAWSEPVPRVVEPLRTLDTACSPPAMSVRATIRSELPIGAIFTPYHDRVLSRPDAHSAVAEIQTWSGDQCHDLHLYVVGSQQEIAAGLLSYRDASCARTDGDPGYMLLAAGPTTTESRTAVAKDLALVIDTSGSMSGHKIEQVRAALLEILDRIGPEDRFDLITFSGEARATFGAMRTGSDLEAVDRARSIARELQANGNTNIHAALMLALDELSSRTEGGAGDRPRMVVFLTDGEATEGVTETGAILDAVAAASSSGVKIHSFGVGDSVNTTLLDGLGRASMGSTRYIRPSDDIEAVLSAFYGEIQAPVATGLELVAEGVDVRDRFPALLPDLFVGSNLFALSRYEAEGSAGVALDATTAVGRATFPVEGEIMALGTVHAFLPRLWASRLLGELLFEARQNGGQDETVARIRELAMRHGFITPWTPFAVDDGGNVSRDYSNPTGEEVGSNAVGTSSGINDLSSNSNAGAYSAGGSAPIRQVLDRTFVRHGGYWMDTRAPAELAGVEAVDVTFGSGAWLALLEGGPAVRELLAVGRSVIFEHRCRFVRVTDPAEHDGEGPAEDPLPEELFEAEDPAASDRLPNPRPRAEAGDLDAEPPSCAAAGGAGDVLVLFMVPLFAGLMGSGARRRRQRVR